MGAPTSSIFSEIYLQDIENTKFYDILIKHQIAGSFRYVDYIVYKKTKTNTHNVLDAFNNTVPNLSFTLEEEVDNTITSQMSLLLEMTVVSTLVYTENRPLQIPLSLTTHATPENTS
jgi:hypothetical protein